MVERLALRDLRDFVALSEELHFARAATRLGVAQPQLSVLVRRLETVVGAPLFRRRPQVALTAAGRELWHSARAVLAEVELAEERVQRAARGEAGVLTVGFASTALLSPVGQALRAYQARYPAVRLRLRELHSGDQLRGLRRGTLDVGIQRVEPRAEGEPEAAADGVRQRTVVEEPLVAVVPARHPLADRPALRGSDLQGQPFVLPPRRVAPLLHGQIAGACAQLGFVPHVVQEADEWHTILALVSLDFGVTIAPACVERIGVPGVCARRLARARDTGLALRWREPAVRATTVPFVALATQLLAPGRAPAAGR